MNLLKTLYVKTENIKGKKLLILLSSIFAVFIIIGAGLGYIISSYLNLYEPTDINELQNQNPSDSQPVEVMYEGRVRFIGDDFYPGENISYMLVDNNGEQVMLLRAKDQKLEVVENLSVTVFGFPAKTMDGETEILEVTKVNITDASN